MRPGVTTCPHESLKGRLLGLAMRGQCIPPVTACTQSRFCYRSFSSLTVNENIQHRLYESSVPIHQGRNEGLYMICNYLVCLAGIIFYWLIEAFGSVWHVHRRLFFGLLKLSPIASPCYSYWENCKSPVVPAPCPNDPGLIETLLPSSQGSAVPFIMDQMRQRSPSITVSDKL